MDVDAVAAELYGLPPRDFVAARDAKAKQARSDGDAAAAREIAALRKPTVVAWLANLLVRERADQVEPLLELGAALREATESLSGPQLRELSQQRSQVVAALVREARALGRDAGQTVTEEMARGLTDTLGAALADPAAAEQLRAGRLAEGLTSSGFGGPAVPSRAPAKTSARPPGAAATRKKQKAAAAATPAERRAAERRERTEAELAEAWSAARAAADARDDAEDDLIRAGDATRAAAGAVRATTAEVERLRGELAQAEQAQADARAAATAASTSETEARKALRAAEKEADRSRRRVADLQRRLDDD
jgi:hypothetical protein